MGCLKCDYIERLITVTSDYINSLSLKRCLVIRWLCAFLRHERPYKRQDSGAQLFHFIFISFHAKQLCGTTCRKIHGMWRLRIAKVVCVCAKRFTNLVKFSLLWFGYKLVPIFNTARFKNGQKRFKIIIMLC